MNKQALYEKLEVEANRGATLKNLDAQIEKVSQLLTDVERGEAWLYAWALVKRHERQLLMSISNEEHDDGARTE